MQELKSWLLFNLLKEKGRKRNMWEKISRLKNRGGIPTQKLN